MHGACSWRGVVTAPPSSLLALLDAAEARISAPSRHAEPVGAVRRVDAEAAIPDAEVSPEAVLPRIVENVNRRPPTSYALLIAQPDGTDTFEVRGMHSGKGDSRSVDRNIGKPSIALGDLASAGPGGEQAADIKYYLREWSRNNLSITAWLESLRNAAAEDLPLVIWDSTGYDIPWELFYLPGDPAAGRPAGWLGAVIPVARKVTIRAYGQAWDPWEATDHSAAGQVVVTIHPAMAADREFLAALNPLDVSQEDVVRHLAEGRDDVGLLYIACHGKYDKKQMLRLRLGKLSLREFDENELPGVGRRHGVVFLNACHSGRMTWDSGQNIALFGFAEVFLRKGAIAVLGVLGKIETNLASRVAADIISRVLHYPGTPLAVILRDVRAAIASEVDAAGPRSKEALKRFLYTFMYVLWGSPHAYLSLDVGHG